MREDGNVEPAQDGGSSPARRRFGARAFLLAFFLAALIASLVVALRAPPDAFDGLLSKGDIRAIARGLGTSAGLLSLGGLVAILMIGAFTLYGDFQKFWTNVQLAFESGTFYFFAGLALLIFARHGSDASEHPSITFILAMLGVAIMLFGTGSQATGALATMGADLPSAPKPGPVDSSKPLDGGQPDQQGAKGRQSDWGPFKANAVIAGGAAVLTAIFAFGVIYFRHEIPEVFNNYDRYVRIKVKPCVSNAANKPCGIYDIDTFANIDSTPLLTYRINAVNENGTPVYVIQNQKNLQILALQEDLRSGPYITLNVQRVGSPPSREAAGQVALAPSFEARIPLKIQANGGARNGEVDPSTCETNATATGSCRLTHLDTEASDRWDENVSTDTYALDFSARNSTNLGQSVSGRLLTADDKSVAYSINIQ